MPFRLNYHLPPPLTPEEKRIVSHVVFVGTWVTALILSSVLLVGLIQTARAQYGTPDQRITVLEVRGNEREATITELKAQIAQLRLRQDEVIWNQQKMYGFAGGMMCLLTILIGLTGANWLNMRKPR